MIGQPEGGFERPPGYRERFSAYVAGSDEKRVLAGVIKGRLVAGTVLDVGAGAGLLAAELGLARHEYLGVEQDCELARRLAERGFRVLVRCFPDGVTGRYDNVLLAYVLPGPAVRYEPLVSSAWRLVARGGRLVIATWRDRPDEYSRLLARVGEPRETDGRRFRGLVAALRGFGQVRVDHTRSHIRANSRDRVAEAVAFLATNNAHATADKRRALHAALSAQGAYIDSRFRRDGGYAFPIEHYVITVRQGGDPNGLG